MFDEVCGAGLTRSLAERSRTVHGVDISEKIANAACKNHDRILGCVADARRLAYQPEIFDLVLSNSTLDHFSNAEDFTEALGELHRVMTPGGMLVITLDNPTNPMIALRSILPHRLLQRFFLVPYYMGVTLSMRRLCDELQGAGFELVDRGTLMHVPRMPAILLSRLMRRAVGDAALDRCLRMLAVWEGLERFPSRRVTG